MERLRRATLAYGALFALAFALSVVMLTTDTNLRTDFGTVPAYFSHWYVVLVTAVADLAGAVGLVVRPSRRAIQGGVVGAGLLALLFLADVFTYQQVGFSSPSAFAQYLFGVTYSGGDVRYLYDGIVAVYLGTFVVGLGLLRSTRSLRSPVEWVSPPT